MRPDPADGEAEKRKSVVVSGRGLLSHVIMLYVSDIKAWVPYCTGHSDRVTVAGRPAVREGLGVGSERGVGDEEGGKAFLSDFPTNRCPLFPAFESCIRVLGMATTTGSWGVQVRVGMIFGVSADSVGRGRRGEERKSIAGWHGE